ncbi:MAG: hypothetical protein AB7F64_03960 [Gammaproteobacteria bacterium]
MKYINNLSFLFLATLLVACSSTSNLDVFHTREKRMMQTEQPPLEIPPGLSNSKIDSYYNIPPVDTYEPTKVSIVPPGSLAAMRQKPKS